MIVQFSQEMLASPKPIVIKAFAPWCPHCNKMKPIFEKLETELGKKYTFAEFDVDKLQDFTKHFQISSLPTFICIKNNQEVGRIFGEMPEKDLQQAIEKYLG